MREQRNSKRNLWSKVSARRVEWRSRRELERYLDESSPMARRELEVILTRDNSAADF